MMDTSRHGFSRQSIILVTAHAFDFYGPAIQEKAVLRGKMNGSEPETCRLGIELLVVPKEYGMYLI